MSLADYVARAFGKTAIWLYRIELDGVVYHYTSRGSGYTTPANRPDTDFPSGQVWTGKAIMRGEIFKTTRAARSDTWLRLPTSDALSAAAIASSGDQDSSVQIWQGFAGDPDNEFQKMFSGRIVRVDPAILLTTLICENSLSETRRSSVAQVVQRPCRHAHYFTNADGGGCRLTLADWQTSHTVTAVSGRTLTIPTAAGEADGYFLAGILEYDGTEYLIESHIGDQVVTETPVAGLAAGLVASPPADSVLLAPGCNLTAEACNAFSNLANFGGFNDMDDSPFDGRSIA